MLCMNTALELKTFKEFFTTDRDVDCVIISRWMTLVKTHHYIIFFVPPLHSKPGMESYCSSSTDQLSW